MIFSIFKIFSHPQILNIVQNHTSMERLFIQLFRWCVKSQFHKIGLFMTGFVDCITYFKFWSYGPLLTVTDVCGTGAGPQARWSVSPSSRSSSSAARAAFVPSGESSGHTADEVCGQSPIRPSAVLHQNHHSPAELALLLARAVPLPQPAVQPRNGPGPEEACPRQRSQHHRLRQPLRRLDRGARSLRPQTSASEETLRTGADPSSTCGFQEVFTGTFTLKVIIMAFHCQTIQCVDWA